MSETRSSMTSQLHFCIPVLWLLHYNFNLSPTVRIWLPLTEMRKTVLGAGFLGMVVVRIRSLVFIM